MKNQKGFTLVELLVTVAIIGVLASMAIPLYSLYKKKAYNAMALSDLRNAFTAQEAYYIDHGEYRSCSGTSCDLVLPGFAHSKGVEMDMTAGGDNAFIDEVTSCHLQGDIGYFTGENLEISASTHAWDDYCGGEGED